MTGGNLKLDLGNDWTLVDKFGYTEGDANTFGLVPEGGAVALSTVADNGASATGAVTGTVYSGDTAVQQFGRWVVEKQIESFTNDLALTKSLDDLNITFGYFTSSFSADDQWSLGNQAYYVVESGGELLTGIDCNDNQDSCTWNYDIDSTGDASTDAFYVAADYQVNEEVRVDVGIRRENHEVEYTVDEGLDGVITKAVQYDESDVAWTAGVNWQFEKNMGVFARASEGSRMPQFDDFRDNFGAFSDGEDLITDITQYEAGFKMAESDYSLYATAFFNEVEGNLFVPRPGAPAEVTTNEAYGIEIDGAYYADNGFSITLNATIQETEITAGAPINGVSVVGNETIRQPGWQVRLTPSYDFAMGDMEATAYAVLHAVDDRFGDNLNTNSLEGYEQIDFGLNVFVTPELEVQFNIQNLTDENGLTEGDPRNPAAPNGRFILPRNATVSVSYAF
jgi:outer membrane receptor protein involved in Fe transport